jgi:hypothetical protein
MDFFESVIDGLSTIFKNKFGAPSYPNQTLVRVFIISR